MSIESELDRLNFAAEVSERQLELAKAIVRDFFQGNDPTKILAVAQLIATNYAAKVAQDHS